MPTIRLSTLATFQNICSMLDQEWWCFGTITVALEILQKADFCLVKGYEYSDSWNLQNYHQSMVSVLSANSEAVLLPENCLLNPRHANCASWKETVVFKKKKGTVRLWNAAISKVVKKSKVFHHHIAPRHQIKSDRWMQHNLNLPYNPACEEKLSKIMSWINHPTNIRVLNIVEENFMM